MLKVPSAPDREYAFDTVPAGRPIVVPVPDEHLTAQGRQRFQPGGWIQADVLGRVERFDDERDVLVLFPVAIYSD